MIAVTGATGQLGQPDFERLIGRPAVTVQQAVAAALRR